MTVEMWVCELCGCYPSSKEQGAVLPHNIALGAAVVGLAVPRQGRLGLLLLWAACEQLMVWTGNRSGA